jgi:signal transduction histidine kinase
VENHLALKRLQHELEMRLEELQARNEELDAFAHTVAHDLKNPLAAIIGYSTLLESRRDQLSEERLAAFITNISQNGQRMNNIIKELLLLSSVRKTEEIEVQPLDMGAIIEGVQERLADMIDEYDVQLDLPASWPEALGRAQWVEEIWANYISNAIKYGGRPPHVTLGGDAPADGAVRFWVRDNGGGLTAEEQAQLFAPFERLHQVKAEGHGLGLSIVRRIVDKLGGSVGVESEVGRGSCFTFSLPPAAS